MRTVKRHPLHSLCSYLGSFPPRVARRLIEEWVPANYTVLDPFCGSGTTLLEAALGGRASIGIDKNPLAAAISAAKVKSVELDDVIFRIQELAGDFTRSTDIQHVPDAVRLIFHDRTLQQLLYLQQCLDLDLPEDVFIRGVILGIMHGKHRRDGSTNYLSIDMPNTFSMSPGYVARFVEKHKLQKKPVDVFGQLRHRATWLLRDGIPFMQQAHSVQLGDATSLPSILADIDFRERAAIVTSPPYLGVLRYGAFNWIRLWFLGYEPGEIDARLDTTDSMDRYLSFMTSFLLAAAQVLDQGAPLAMVIGDVVENGQHVQLAPRVWEELEDVVPFSRKALYVDDFNENDKTTRIWGEDRKGRATPTERILVVVRR